MDESTRRELVKLRADAIAMCDVSRKLAEHVVELIDAELAEPVSHRKPGRLAGKARYLTVVKGIITGAAAFAALRRLAAATAASAVTAAAVTVVAAPLVLRSPSPPPASPRQPAAARLVPHRGRRRPVVTVQRSSVPATMATVGTGQVPAASPSPSPSPLISVSISPSPSAPSCLIRLLGLCIP